MTAYVPIYTSTTYVYAKTGLSATQVDLTDDDEVRMIIEDAEVMVETLTGRKFTSGNTMTDTLSGSGQDVLENYQSNIQLSHFPIQSITSFITYDSDGTADETYDNLSSAEISAGTFRTDDYVLEMANDPLTNRQVPTGKIHLITDTFTEGHNNIYVAYTYGYSTVPVAVRNLATCLAGIKLWERFLGVSFDKAQSYSVPEQSVNKGDIYSRGLQNMQVLQKEADELLDRIGRKPRVLFFASGGSR